LAEKKLSKDKAVEPEVKQAEDIETLKQILVEEKEKAEKYLVNWQRSQADFSNYKKHAEQEKNEIIEFANSTLILNLLPIMDDLERAFASAPAELAKSSWTEGMRLIYNKLKAILEAQGLAEIKAEGEVFDPHLHEAVMSREGEEGMVIEEIEKGYELKGRMIRPSKVTVGTGEEEKEVEQTNEKEE
jgi:molecular chaperone GrpE